MRVFPEGRRAIGIWTPFLTSKSTSAILLHSQELSTFAKAEYNYYLLDISSDDDLPQRFATSSAGHPLDNASTLRHVPSIASSSIHHHGQESNIYGSGPSQDTLNAPFASRAQPPAGFDSGRGRNKDDDLMDDYDYDSKPRSSNANRGYAGGDDYMGSSSSSYKKKTQQEEDMDEFDQIDSLSWDYAAQALPHLQADRDAQGQGTHIPQAYEPRSSLLDHLKRLKPPSAPLSSLKELSWNPFSSGGKGDVGDVRTIYLNDFQANGKGRGGKKGTENEGKRRWKGNEIGTGKYNVVTFLPKFLFGESGVRVRVGLEGGQSLICRSGFGEDRAIQQICQLVLFVHRYVDNTRRGARYSEQGG